MYFQRPDGRVIPRCGYRLDDVLDDGVNPADVVGTSAEVSHADGMSEGQSERPSERPSADPWWLAAVVSGRNPSAEVREARATYRVA
jgi:hypothetical protein